jgi:hypothetical protein
LKKQSKIDESIALVRQLEDIDKRLKAIATETNDVKKALNKRLRQVYLKQLAEFETPNTTTVENGEPQFTTYNAFDQFKSSYQQWA